MQNSTVLPEQILYLSHDEIDFQKWDECIAKAVNGYVYAYSWYLDSVAIDWDALILGNYEAVFPLPFRKKFGLNYIYPAVFTQQLGLFNTSIQGENILEEFIQAIPNKFKLIEINLNKYNKVESLSYSVKSKTNIELSLAQEYSIIYSKYNSNLKRNLKKAKEANLQIALLNKPDEVINLFSSNRQAAEQPFSNSDFWQLKKLMYKTFQNGSGEIYGCYSMHNELLAAAYFVESNNRVIFLFSGNSPEGKTCGALPFLLDYKIQLESSTQKIFDFEGSNNANLAQFYSSFGSQQFTYNYLRINRMNPILTTIFKIYKRLKQ